MIRRDRPAAPESAAYGLTVKVSSWKVPLPSLVPTPFSKKQPPPVIVFPTGAVGLDSRLVEAIRIDFGNSEAPVEPCPIVEAVRTRQARPITSQ